jgi:uncharacterized protein with FMN-binding domain
MSADQSVTYKALLVLSGVFSVLAVVTLLPNAAASKPNILGYRSVCSFAPAATALCGLLAGITCTMRNRYFSKNAASTRFQPPFALVVVGLALIAVAVVSWIGFSRAQIRFTAVIERTSAAGSSLGGLADGTRSATVSDGDVSATVELTVSSGRIQAIGLKEAINIEASVAATIFDAVKAAQSSQVDAVSGATASSQVLLKAIEQAAAGK